VRIICVQLFILFPHFGEIVIDSDFTMSYKFNYYCTVIVVVVVVVIFICRRQILFRQISTF